MTFRPLIMIVFLALELVLFLFNVGITGAVPHGNTHYAPFARRNARAVVETARGIVNTTMLNHLPEDKNGAGAAAVTHSWVATPANTGNTIVSTPAAPSINATEAATTKKITNKPDLSHTAAARTASVTRTATAIAVVNATFAIPAPDMTKSAGPETGLTTKTRQAELPCNCSAEGTLDPEECDRSTGQCVCMPGYTGAQCEVCEDGYFNNGTAGCLPCSCDSFGAVDHRCDSSGACTCKTGVYGPQCDECHPGFFRFSSTGCQPCECHNHSSYCHPQSGVCLDCQGNTQGPSCEECRLYFYRRPEAALTDTCMACPCSPLSSTGTCHTDASGLPVCEQCRPGYNGSACARCAEGFYRSAGSCQPCDCSGNADPHALPLMCHPDTGVCLSCANHTAGPHCERCAPGYAGDALRQACVKTTVRLLPTPMTTVTVTTVKTAMPTAPPSGQPVSTTTNLTDFTSLLSSPPLTSPSGPASNITATVTAVSWAQFNVIILAVIVVAVALLMGAAAAVYAYREYQNRKLNAPFWTIELKEDNISFSSYHDSLPNADVSGLLEDEAGQAAPNGQLALSSPANAYKA